LAVAAATTPIDARGALLAGATGLVGRSLLALLLESPRYRRVQVLLRRAAPDLAAHPRLATAVVDFAALPPLPPVDDVFIALGTTIRVAGSQQAFRRVDFDAVLATARAGRAAGARRLLVVSALGADPASTVFYSRVKGEMQQAIVTLGYESVVIVQPSLLLGDRAALGQPKRTGEEFAQRLLRPLLGWVPSRVRPIRAEDVARAMLRAALEASPGVTILGSGEMQPRQRPDRARG
jgi:uncharacterized protein YbjT (DUF2867 family)